MRCISLIALAFSAPAVAFRVRTKKNNVTRGGMVVTLGDSYSSGVGIYKKKSDYVGGDCQRDLKSIAGAQYAESQGMQSVNLACAGGEIPDAFPQFEKLKASYPQDAKNGFEGSTIVFTIGGNDLRTYNGKTWGGVLTSCIASFYGACHEEQGNQVANFDTIRRQATSFYKTVAKGASKASIRVLGYPRLLRRGWHCIPVPGVSAGATKWADNMVDEFNSYLQRAMVDTQSAFPNVDIKFVPVNKYLTKGACSTGGQHVHAIVLDGVSISPMTFHPHQRGYTAYYKALGNSLGRSVPPSQVPPGSPEPWELESIFDGWDAQKDGQLSIDEVLSMGGEDADDDVLERLRSLFGDADADQDGFLNLQEFQEFLNLVATADEAD